MTQASTARARPVDDTARSRSTSTGRSPARTPRPEPPRRLKVIPARPPRRRLPFLLLVGATIVAGVLGLSALSVAVNQQAFRISELTAASRDVERRYSVLQAEVDELRSPQRIAAIAQHRGLQPVTRARIQSWPGQPAAQRTEPEAASSPAASHPEGGDATKELAGRVWTPDDPFPLKHYLAQP